MTFRLFSLRREHLFSEYQTPDSGQPSQFLLHLLLRYEETLGDTRREERKEEMLCRKKLDV